MNKTLDLVSARDWLGSALQSHKELLLPIAGVFFFLPNLAFSYVTNWPLTAFQSGIAQITASLSAPGANVNVAVTNLGTLISDYYAEIWPWLLSLLLLTFWGSIILYRIFLHPGREDVGQAIRASLPMILPIFLANILAGVIAGLVAAVPIMLGGLTGNAGIIMLMMLLSLACSTLVTVRLYLYSAAMIETDTKNPISGLMQSWAATEGNFWRIFGYSAMLIIATFVIYMVFSLVVGLVDTMIFGAPKAGDMPLLSTILSAMFSAVMAVLVAGAVSSVWRQLSPSSDNAAKAFD